MLKRRTGGKGKGKRGCQPSRARGWKPTKNGKKKEKSKDGRHRVSGDEWLQAYATQNKGKKEDRREKNLRKFERGRDQ